MTASEWVCKPHRVRFGQGPCALCEDQLPLFDVDDDQAAGHDDQGGRVVEQRRRSVRSSACLRP